MAEFMDLSASDLLGGFLTYQSSKTAAKPAADARLTSTQDGTAVDGRTGTAAGAALTPTVAGLPLWLVMLGVGVGVAVLVMR